MQKIYCDKCGCELTALTDFRLAVGGMPVESFDLCGDCREELIDWLGGCQTVEMAESQPMAEDPLYGGPRNDRTGYTVEDLMGITGRNFYGVLAGLEQIGVTAVCWKRDGQSVYRFYLSPDQLEALKK